MSKTALLQAQGNSSNFKYLKNIKCNLLQTTFRFSSFSGRGRFLKLQHYPTKIFQQFITIHMKKKIKIYF